MIQTILISTPYAENVEKIPGVVVRDINQLTIKQLEELHNFYHFSLIIEVDSGKVYDQAKENILKAKKLGITTAFYCWDGVFKDRPYFEYSALFDYAFTTDSFLVPEFKAKKNLWLPMSCPDKILTPDLTEHKVIPMLFFGSIFNERVELLESLQERFNSNQMLVLGHEGYTSESFNKYRVLTQLSYNVFNYGMSDHLSIRPFEAIGCGARCVTNNLSDFTVFPSLLEYCSVYTNHQEAAAVVDQTIKQYPDDKFKKQAREFILTTHTTSLRIKQLIRMIQDDTTWTECIGG